MTEVKFISLIEISEMIKNNDQESHDYLVNEYSRLSSIIKDYEISMRSVVKKMDDTFFKTPAYRNK